MGHRNKIWVIADTHFGHVKTLEFRSQFSSMQEHDDYLVERWNSVVHPKDTVWHLGDVVLGGSGNLTILERLNGNKKLVMGNHDTYPMYLYLKYFTRVYGAVRFAGFILTHIPVAPSQKKRFKGNIHGHLHDRVVFDPWYRCVSVEQTDFAPILFDQVVEEMA